MEDITKFLRDRGVIDDNSIKLTIIKDDGGEINLNELIEEYSSSYNEKYIRTLAELENFKKRVSKQKEQLKKEVQLKTLESVLDIHNELSIAVEKTISEEARRNFQSMLKKLDNSFKSIGLEKVKNKQYDVDIHEVISIVNCEKHGIYEVVSNGYIMNDEIIRYPKIILGKCDGE
jgi:molecular chaperone GrpE